MEWGRSESLMLTLEMKKIAALVFLVFTSLSTSAQDVYLDTVFVKRMVGFDEFEMDTLVVPSHSFNQVLVGTTFLPYSDKMIRLLNDNISPISLELLNECNGSIDPNKFDDYPQFDFVSMDSNVLTIDVTVIANCCHNFLGEAELVGTDTLNLLYTSYGGFCSCSCCFTLRYKFDVSGDFLKFVTINGSKKIGYISDRKKF